MLQKWHIDYIFIYGRGDDIQQRLVKALTKNSATILDLSAAFGFTGAEMKCGYMLFS